MKSTFLKYLIIACCLTVLLSVSAFAFDLQGGTVDVNSAVNFRKEASTSSKILGKLYDGERVAVLDKVGSFYRVVHQGNVGYLHSDYVDLQPIMNIEAGYIKVTTTALNVRSGPGTEFEKMFTLLGGCTAKIIGINDGWFKINFGGQKGYISPKYVSIGNYTGEYYYPASLDAPAPTVPATPAPSTPSAPSAPSTPSTPAVSAEDKLRQEICDYAATFLGVPYVWGGTTPNGFDCSGLVKYVYNHFGISISRTSYDQYHRSVKKISKSQLKPGDLVFFTRADTGNDVGHVGIYVGNDTFIHAPRTGKNVEYAKLSSSYYVKNYVGSGTMFK